MLKLNEGKICDAIIRHLEAKAGTTRADVQTHDRHADPTKRIELTFRLGPELIAIEHTGIEPFGGFMKLNAEAAINFDGIRNAIKDAIPPNTVIELHLPAKGFQGRTRKEIRPMQDALARFIINAVPALPVRRYSDYIGDIAPTSVPDVPFPVTLYRFESLDDMQPFQIIHRTTGIEEARADRLRETCEKKFPKLTRWKTVDNVRTVLVLESNDIQLTGHHAVTDALLPIVHSRNDAPDEIYMIHTSTNLWHLWPILIGNESYFELERRGHPIHSEIDPKTLCAVTER